MRAGVRGLLKLDRPVLGDQLACLDGPVTGSPTLGTKLRRLRILRLLGGGFLGESPSDVPADFVRASFYGLEVKLLDLVVGAEDLEGNLAEDLFETKIGDRTFRVRGGTKHGESSVTTTNCPDRPGLYQKVRDLGIDLLQSPSGGTRAFLHPSVSTAGDLILPQSASASIFPVAWA
jgi:hypothetical protein